jgi:hypothetical protein
LVIVVPGILRLVTLCRPRIQGNRTWFILRSASVVCYYYFAALASI